MYQVTVLYNQPEDPAAFDKHYDEVHVPLVSKIPGLLRFSVSRPAPGPKGQPAPFHLVAVLEFESAEAYGEAMATPEGEATRADIANFGQAGVTLLTGPTVVV